MTGDLPAPQVGLVEDAVPGGRGSGDTDPMETRIPREATEAFAALAELVYAGTGSDEILTAICQTAVDVIPGADHACISTLDANEQLRTRAASDDVAGRWTDWSPRHMRDRAWTRSWRTPSSTTPTSAPVRSGRGWPS